MLIFRGVFPSLKRTAKAALKNGWLEDKNSFQDGLVPGATLPKTNVAMENGPFEDVFPIKNGDIPLLC